MMKNYKIIMLSSVLGLFSPYSLAEVCSKITLSIKATTPTEQFKFDVFEFDTDKSLRVVTDKTTNLMWMQCPLGVAYDISEGRCEDPTEQSQFTWSQALNAMETLSPDLVTALPNWRLPNIKELASIIEYQCWEPAVNEEVFPGANNGVFWSSTPKVNEDDLIVMLIDFHQGKDKSIDIESESNPSIPFVRLVRDVTSEDVVSE